MSNLRIIDFSVLSSSLILSKISTFASTAIPTVKIIPAIPGKVRVASNIVKTPTSINKFEIKATLAITPKILYFNIIKIITKINPITREIVPDFIESSPKSGPTVLSSTIFKGVGNAPERNNKAKSVTSKAKVSTYCSASPSDWFFYLRCAYYFVV